MSSIFEKNIAGYDKEFAQAADIYKNHKGSIDNNINEMLERQKGINKGTKIDIPLKTLIQQDAVKQFNLIVDRVGPNSIFMDLVPSNFL